MGSGVLRGRLSADPVVTGYLESERLGLADRLAPPRTHPTRTLQRVYANTLLELLEEIGPRAGSLVVDFGCSTRAFEQPVLDIFDRYLGVDLLGNPVADLVISADSKVGIRSATADVVLSLQVIEHVPDVSTYLDECGRLLRPGGTLILSTNGQYRYHADPEDYWRWTRAGLRLQLERSGFEVTRLVGVLSGASAALQLLQHTTEGAIPPRARPVYRWIVQGLIGLVEGRPESSRNDDNAVAIFANAKLSPAR